MTISLAQVNRWKQSVLVTNLKEAESDIEGFLSVLASSNDLDEIHDLWLTIANDRQKLVLLAAYIAEQDETLLLELNRNKKTYSLWYLSSSITFIPKDENEWNRICLLDEFDIIHQCRH